MGGTTRVVLSIRVPFRVLFIGVPYYIGDLRRDPRSRGLPTRIPGFRFLCYWSVEF